MLLNILTPETLLPKVRCREFSLLQVSGVISSGKFDLKTESLKYVNITFFFLNLGVVPQVLFAG